MLFNYKPLNVLFSTSVASDQTDSHVITGPVITGPVGTGTANNKARKARPQRSVLREAFKNAWKQGSITTQVCQVSSIDTIECDNLELFVSCVYGCQ